MNRTASVVAAGLLILTGCATGERIDIAIPGSSSSSAASASGGVVRVVVTPFTDARADQRHLGTRAHFWGDTSYFDLPQGTVGEAVAKSLVQQLNKRGWQASLVGQGGGKPDATITGSIRDLSVSAISKFGRTEIAVKNTMTIRVANHGDESAVQEQVYGSGSDEVFWFDPEDAQQLVNEVIEKNVEKFLADTKVEGRAVRLR